MKIITLYRGGPEGEKCLVEEGSQGDLEHRAVGFAPLDEGGEDDSGDEGDGEGDGDQGGGESAPRARRKPGPKPGSKRSAKG